MIISESSKRNIILFAVGFLLCGFLHVVLQGVGFTECFSQLYCGGLVLLWALSVQKRVTDTRLRNLLLSIAAMIMVFFLLQIMRYRLFCFSYTAQRYLWYFYYIPMMALSLLCFCLTLSIHRPKKQPLPAAYALLAVAGVLLLLGLLTNDIHHWAFRCSTGVLVGDGEEEHMWLYYMIVGYILVVYLLSYCVVAWKCRKYVSGGLRILPLIPIFAAVLYTVLYAFDAQPQIGGVSMWNVGEIFGVCTIVFLEICIQIGMIPANKDYNKLLSGVRLPMAILDDKGNPIFRTAGAQSIFPKDKDVQIMHHPISGGSIEWAVGMRQVRVMNQQLADATQQLEIRNAYLKEENRIKQEKAELETRNRLYDRISQIVRRQLSMIDELLNSPDGDLEQKLPKIAVLKAYVKRRSNIELLASSGLLPMSELTAAVAESLEYMKLCGVNTAVASFGTGAYPAEMIIAAYEHFEAVAEDSLDTLSHMNVTVHAEEKRLDLRILLKADGFACNMDGERQEGASFCGKVAVTEEEQDMFIVLTLTERGGCI